MKHAETIAPVAAALSALATLTCCLPIAFAAGTATAGLAVIAGSYRWWFLGTSIALLAVGAVQFVQARRACRPRGAVRTAILVGSAVIVLLVLVFPQALAGLIADWLPWTLRQTLYDSPLAVPACGVGHHIPRAIGEYRVRAVVASRRLAGKTDRPQAAPKPASGKREAGSGKLEADSPLSPHRHTGAGGTGNVSPRQCSIRGTNPCPNAISPDR